MRSLKLLAIVAVAPLAGCVLGHGRCLFLEPMKTTLTGTVHFREFPAENHTEHVPILSLDGTEYVYTPAQSRQCQSAHEIQLVPITDLPDNIADNAHVAVEGTIVDATQNHQHTRFVLNVSTIRLVKKP